MRDSGGCFDGRNRLLVLILNDDGPKGPPTHTIEGLTTDNHGKGKYKNLGRKKS